MLNHNKKLKKLATKNGKVDGRRMRSNAFLRELVILMKKGIEKDARDAGFSVEDVIRFFRVHPPISMNKIIVGL